MQSYQVMQLVNTLLLLVCSASVGALWKNYLDDKKAVKEEISSNKDYSNKTFDKVFDAMKEQQKDITAMYTSTKLLAQQIELNQKMDDRRMGIIEKLIDDRR